MKANWTNFKEKCKYVHFAFYPLTSIITCLVSMVVLDTIFIMIFQRVEIESEWRSIMLALITGVTGSFIVSIVIELSNNYKNNRLGYCELSDYYSAIMNYEESKQIGMQNTSFQIIQKKAREDFIASGGKCDDSDIDEPKDIVQIAWEELPKMMPMLKETYENKKEYLTNKEIDAILNIINSYDLIRSQLRRNVMSQYIYNTLNHPDEGYLNHTYPQNIIDDMPEVYKRQLAENACEEAVDKLMETILSDNFLLKELMDGYDISENAIKVYEESEEYKATEEEQYIDDNYDDCYDEETEEECYEEETEEEFKQRNEEFDKWMEESNKPFVCWFISTYCKRISDNLDILLKYLKKKPYYGLVLGITNKGKDPSMNDEYNKMLYDMEMKHLRENDSEANLES